MPSSKRGTQALKARPEVLSLAVEHTAGASLQSSGVAVLKGASSTTRSALLLSALGLALLGVALGLSQIVRAAYDEAMFAPLALGGLALALALATGVPRRLPLAGLLPLLGLWAWSYLSAAWSDSGESAHTAAARWLLYAATLALLCWAIGDDRRRAIVLLTGAAAGVLGVAGWMLVRMLDGDGAALFHGTRLNDPVGYINGQAGFLLVGVWPCLALAERSGSKRALFSGAGVAGVTALTALGLLTQSRSWGVAFAVTLLLVLAAIPGRRRRAAALLLCGATIALLYVPLADVWRHPGEPVAVPTDAATHDAAVAMLVGALVAGALWTIAVLAFERLAPTGSGRRTKAARIAGWVLAAVAVLAVLGIGANAGTIKQRVERQYDAFVKLAPTSGGTRFFSGGGDRYDYWRVALIEFRSQPLHGVGGGNYRPGYYLHRRTTEDIQQPHSLELQTLAELGVVGALLLGVFLAAVASGFVRTARAARDDRAARTLAVAAGGIFAAWLVQTSVDWLHLLPGLTAIALAAVAGLLVRPGNAAAAPSGRGRVVTIAVAFGIACAGALTIAPRVLSLHERGSAERALAARQPRAAIAHASRALDFDPDSLAALELRAAGMARLGAFAPARADIRRAIALEPRNWVMWALLGDLLTRRGDRTGARSAYGRAVALNPLDPSLQTARREATRAPER